ncbi:MAG: 30S ribosome-binding factor RbfA [Clostridia bacterium]|nr:30S ribosome-binding factor RbfA [Clostridia bacterium]
MKVKRTDKINSEIKKIVYEIIRTDINVPSITEMFSITDVDCAPDLKSAKVYVSVFSTNEEKKMATFQGIKGASSEIRRALSSKMRTRCVPELHFYLDSALEYGNKIDKIISGFKYYTKEDDNDLN